MPITRKEKPKAVEDLVKLLRGYKCIGIIDLHKLPARQLQEIREALRGKALIKVAKKCIIERALKKLGLEELASQIRGMPAVIASNLDAFSLFAEIKRNKSKREARAGDIASEDIVIEPGPTELTPGPSMAELQKLGFKVRVEGGKVAIKERKVLCKKGERITEEIASVCNLLKLKPIDVMLNLIAAWEDGVLYTKEVLDIDVESYIASIVKAHQEMFTLAVEAKIFVDASVVEFLLQRAYREAKELAKEARIITSETIEELLALAAREANELEREVGKSKKE